MQTAYLKDPVRTAQ